MPQPEEALRQLLRHSPPTLISIDMLLSSQVGVSLAPCHARCLSAAAALGARSRSDPCQSGCHGGQNKVPNTKPGPESAYPTKTTPPDNGRKGAVAPPLRQDYLTGGVVSTMTMHRPAARGRQQQQQDWGRKSFVEELLAPDCKRIVVSSMEPCVVRSLSLAGKAAEVTLYSLSIVSLLAP